MLDILKKNWKVGLAATIATAVVCIFFPPALLLVTGSIAYTAALPAFAFLGTAATAVVTATASAIAAATVWISSSVVGHAISSLIGLFNRQNSTKMQQPAIETETEVDPHQSTVGAGGESNALQIETDTQQPTDEAKVETGVQQPTVETEGESNALQSTIETEIETDTQQSTDEAKVKTGMQQPTVVNARLTQNNALRRIYVPGDKLSQALNAHRVQGDEHKDNSTVAQNTKKPTNRQARVHPEQMSQALNSHRAQEDEHKDDAQRLSRRVVNSLEQGRKSNINHFPENSIYYPRIKVRNRTRTMEETCLENDSSTHSTRSR